MGKVNYVPPFRDVSGRTKLQCLKQLAERAGHAVDLRELDRDAWIHASREANEGRYSAMSRSIESALLWQR